MREELRGVGTVKAEVTLQSWSAGPCPRAGWEVRSER